VVFSACSPRLPGTVFVPFHAQIDVGIFRPLVNRAGADFEIHSVLAAAIDETVGVGDARFERKARILAARGFRL
jgi:hypothetical protein